MAVNRSRFESSHDDGYWSIVAEFIDRCDRGEAVDAAEFAHGDPELAKRLQECLAGFGWLERALSGSDVHSVSETETRLPESIGEYNIIRELGRGGMGVVYEAVHQGLGRRVALKVLFDSSIRGGSARERFLREARTAASLHHTNIVPVFDAGSADGHLYFAMQLIEGESLEELASKSHNPHAASFTPFTLNSQTTAEGSGTLSNHRTSLKAQHLARLGLQAAEALAYAHAHGVVHRDIKPSNLILDQSGTLWVADFGLARRPEDTSVTASGARVGTPRYMSPEQASAQWDALDARTDVYSLGVTLYELLTGQPVFSESTPQELYLQILRMEPARPRRLNPRIPRDLETIVIKAMAKRPADRYRSAQELADDLRRFLAHEPVRARLIGPLGRTIRWCRREPLVATVTLVALFTLATVVVAFQVNLKSERDQAIDAKIEAQIQLADSLFHRARAERNSPDFGRRWLSLDLLKQSGKIKPRPELSVESIRALEIIDVRRTHDLGVLGGPVSAVAFDRTSPRLALAVNGGDGPAVCLWDRGTESIIERLAVPAAVQTVAFSPDGRRLAAATDRHICLWELDSKKMHVIPGVAPAMTSLTFSSDSQRLFGFAGGLCVWDASSGKLESKLVEGEIEIGLIAISGDGATLAASVTNPEMSGPEIARWSLPDLRPLEPIRIREQRPDPLAAALGVLALAASPAGNTIAASCGDSRIRLWDIETGKPLGVLEGHRVPATSLAFTEGGDCLISTDGFEVKLWEVHDCIELATLIRPDSSTVGSLTGLAISGDGIIATAGDRGQLWELSVPKFHHVFARQRDSIQNLAMSRDGRRLAWGSNRRLMVSNWPDGRVPNEWPIAVNGDAAATFCGDDRRIAVVGSGTRSIKIFDVGSGECSAEWPCEPASVVASTSDGRELLVAHTDGIIRRWSCTSGQVTAALAGHVGPVNQLAISPNGRWLAAATRNVSDTQSRTLHVWDLLSGKLAWSEDAHRTVAFGVAFTPDSRRLASCGDRTVKVWDVVSGDRIASYSGPMQPVRRVAYNSEGTMFAACSADGHMFIWDATSGKLMADLTSRASGSLAGVLFSPDDQWVLGCGGPFRWTHSGPGAIEGWNLKDLRRELSELGMAW